MTLFKGYIMDMTKKIQIEMNTKPCWKCSGSGFIQAYSGVANGICFACKGSKVSPATPKDAAISKAFNKAKTQVSQMKQIPVENLKVGNRIQYFDVFSGIRSWKTILEIKESASYGIEKLPNGEEIKRFCLELTLSKVPNQEIRINYYKGQLVEVAWPIEKKFEAIRENLPEKYKSLLKIVE